MISQPDNEGVSWTALERGLSSGVGPIYSAVQWSCGVAVGFHFRRKTRSIRRHELTTITLLLQSMHKVSQPDLLTRTKPSVDLDLAFYILLPVEPGALDLTDANCRR